MTYDGMSHYYHNEGKNVFTFPIIHESVQVLSMEKAKRFLSHDCDGPSATLQR